MAIASAQVAQFVLRARMQAGMPSMQTTCHRVWHNCCISTIHANGAIVIVCPLLSRLVHLPTTTVVTRCQRMTTSAKSCHVAPSGDNFATNLCATTAPGPTSMPRIRSVRSSASFGIGSHYLTSMRLYAILEVRGEKLCLTFASVLNVDTKKLVRY